MSNENGIDPKKLNEMKVKILRAEQANLRTREKPQMKWLSTFVRLLLPWRKRILRRKDNAYKVSKNAEL